MTGPRLTSAKATTPSPSTRTYYKENNINSLKRRRGSRAGTRSVTTLSASQLERKRANDREAQRTIRQRTKEHIENLENRVSELTAKGRQLDDALVKNIILENKVAQLKEQLALANQQLGLLELQHSPLYNSSMSGLARTDSSQSTRDYSPATTEGSQPGVDWNGTADAIPFQQGAGPATTWPSYTTSTRTLPTTSMPMENYGAAVQWSSAVTYTANDSTTASPPTMRSQDFGYTGQQRQVYNQSPYGVLSHQHSAALPYSDRFGTIKDA